MKDKKAFTLAETLIVLVILGIIASITIPAVVRRQMEAQNRARIKKAMTVYDTVLNKMVVENGIRSNDALIKEFNAENNNGSCAKSRAYFKVAQDGVDDCTFRASDGVWWNISDINHPIIAFDDDDLTDEIASGDTNKAFRLVGYLDGVGILRVGDLGVATDKNQEYLEKLYNFANNIKPAGDTCKKTKVCDNTGHCDITDCNNNLVAQLDYCSDVDNPSTCRVFVFQNNSDGSSAIGDDCSDIYDINTCNNIGITVSLNNEEYLFEDCTDPTSYKSCTYLRSSADRPNGYGEFVNCDQSICCRSGFHPSYYPSAGCEKDN